MLFSPSLWLCLVSLIQINLIPQVQGGFTFISGVVLLVFCQQNSTLFSLLLMSFLLLCDLLGDDSDDYNHCETATSCNGLIVTVIDYAIAASRVPFTTKDIVVVGVHHGYALAAIESWIGATNYTYDIVVNENISNVVFSNYKMIYIPSDHLMTSGGIECEEVDLLETRTADIANYVNSESGSLMALTQETCENGWSWLPISLNFESTNIELLTVQPNLLNIVDTLNETSLDHCCYHTKFTGPEGYGGLLVLATGDMMLYCHDFCCFNCFCLLFL